MSAAAAWTLPGILRATGGELVRWGPGPFAGVSSDSRRVGRGELFFALPGPRHDGHDHVGAAVAAGAAGVVVSRDLEPAEGAAWIRVGDALDAFGDLAAARRRRLPVRVVGITGSNGKTTTKEMTAAVLGASGAKVARSHGTENNLVGVPQTLFRLSGDEAYAVVEMGMNHPGEIWRLVEIARPDVGVITNVGPAHLEGLGSIANVAAAKGELALGLPSGATLVVNGEDPRLRPIADAYPGPTVRTGEGGPVRAAAVAPAEGGLSLALEIDGQRVPVRLRCVGGHNVANALLAAAVGRAFGLDAAAIVAGLEAFTPPPMRLEAVRLPGGARVWNDAYNANPASMEAALGALAAEPARRRIAVLGEMWELGPDAARWHREAGRRAAEAGVDLLVAVGRYAVETAAGAREAGLPAPRTRACETTAEAADLLRGELREGDLALVKGSRGARMEEIVAKLAEAR